MKAISSQTIINSIRSRKDGSLGFSAETPELTVEEKIAFMNLQGQVLETIFKPLEDAEDVITVDKDVERKTQSQRMRSVIFLLWKKQGEQGEFSDYYHQQTEKIINKIKSMLD